MEMQSTLYVALNNKFPMLHALRSDRLMSLEPRAALEEMLGNPNEHFIQPNRWHSDQIQTAERMMAEYRSGNVNDIVTFGVVYAPTWQESQPYIIPVGEVHEGETVGRYVGNPSSWRGKHHGSFRGDQVGIGVIGTFSAEWDEFQDQCQREIVEVVRRSTEAAARWG